MFLCDCLSVEKGTCFREVEFSLCFYFLILLSDMHAYKNELLI